MSEKIFSKASSKNSSKDLIESSTILRDIDAILEKANRNAQTGGKRKKKSIF